MRDEDNAFIERKIQDIVVIGENRSKEKIFLESKRKKESFISNLKVLPPPTKHYIMIKQQKVLNGAFDYFQCQSELLYYHRPQSKHHRPIIILTHV